MPEEKEEGFLVTVEVYLLGGQLVETEDAFRAKDKYTARNLALNTFIAAEGMIIYGDAAFVLDAIEAIQVTDVSFIDLEHPDNYEWLQSVEVFDNFMKEISGEEGRRPVAAGPGSGN